MDLSTYKCGFVAIVGRPNVGKSTLMNKLVGEKLSIISPKPQTTRRSIKAFISDEEKQIVFLDTPGFLKPRYELQTKLLEYIDNALQDADVIVFMTIGKSFPTDYDKDFLEIMKKIRTPKIGIFNKSDLIDDEKRAELDELAEQDIFDEIYHISALNDDNFDPLIKSITKYLPFSPPLYDPEHISDMPMKFFVQEIIREKIFLNYSDEIPYSSTVTVEKYLEQENKVEIHANIWLERDTQKMILLGKNGAMIKQLRIDSEKEIHKFVQKRIKLNLWVKIKKGWRKKKNAMKEFGYR